MTAMRLKLVTRTLLFAGIAVVGIFLFAGRAHALDQTSGSTATPAPTPPAATPVASTNQSSTPPPSQPQAQPTAPTPAGAPGPNDPTATPAPSGTQSATPTPSDSSAPPATSSSAPTTNNPAPASGSDPSTPPAVPTNDQTSTVGNTGTAVANSGGNSSDASATPAPPVSGSNPASSTSGVTTGTSGATGTQSTTTISQVAQANASDTSSVEILQLALVVNIGAAKSNSGHNLAGSAAAPIKAGGKSTAGVKSGNAKATGNSTHTSVTQAAIITSSDASSQTTTVLNIGIALSNTGLNISIATVNAGTSPVVMASSAGVTSSKIGTGAATSTGDKSASTIQQNANASASGTATMQIDQRAFVINFGVALANTGGNFALSSFDPSQFTPEEAAIIEALLNAIAPMINAGAVGPTGSNATATVTSGSATAVGNATSTTIQQTVQASVAGSENGSAKQLAQVANLGLALANSGFNGVIAQPQLASTPGTALAEAQAEGFVVQFLSLLTNPNWTQSSNPFAQFATSVNFGNLTLDLGATVTGTDMFAGWDSAFAPDGGPIPGGVHVRQISAVLNIGFATSDSGNNVVISIAQAGNDGNAPVMASSLRQVSAAAADPTSATALVTSGNATSVGLSGTMSVCQALNDSVVCDPPPPPRSQPPSQTPHPVPVTTVKAVQGPVAVVVPVAAPSPISAPASDPAPAASHEVTADPGTGTLPFTGGESSALAELGAALLALGALGTRVRRRVFK